MLVSDYLNSLTTSEINQLHFSDIGGLSPTDNQKKNRDLIINYINLANVKLHKKFALLQKELILSDVSANTMRDIPIDFLYAVSASFADGEEIPLNNEKANIVDGVDRNVSVLFPAPFKALVKGTDDKGRTDMSIVYVASPAKVTQPSDFIDISEIYTEALVNYVAYKAHASVSGDMKAENNTYYLRFIQSCKNISMLGLTNSDNMDSNDKLIDRGFV